VSVSGTLAAIPQIAAGVNYLFSLKICGAAGSCPGPS